MELDVTLMRFVRAVSRAGSFSRAARDLGYSQAAVSQRIRRFELSLGMPLFVRMPRGVIATEVGEIIVSRAVEALSTLELAEQEIEALENLAAGRVRIVAFPSVSATVLPLAMARLAETNPQLGVTFREEMPDEALGGVRSASSDLGIVYRYSLASQGEDADANSLERTSLMVDPLYVIMSRNHRLARRAEVELDELRDETWIAGRRVEEVFHGHGQLGFTPKRGPEVTDSVVAQSFVATGHGIAVMPRLVVLASHNSGVLAKPLRSDLQRTIEVVTLRTIRSVPAVAATIAALEMEAGDIGTELN